MQIERTARAWRSLSSAAVGAVIGAGFLMWLTGTRPIDPSEIEWLMKGDWLEHHFGWQYFRSEPWHWPPGTITGYYAPLGTSIGLTDSIPLVAFLLKPLAGVLPQPFQYLGLWVLLCFALQGALGARLVSRWTDAPAAQWLSAALFVLVPTLMTRVGHAALCAHWLILWTLLIATCPPAERHRPAEWAVLGLVAGLIQPYLAAMVLPMLTVVAVGTRAVAVATRATMIAAAAAGTLAGWWLSGMFILTGAGSLSSGGLGYYSMNLLAPVTPGGWSRFLPELPIAGDGQAYEGFHYLGLGILLLLAAAAVMAVRNGNAEPGARRTMWTPGLVGVCLLMAAFAVSPKITAGPFVIADLLGEWSAPLSIFRSSGRFFWPFTYVALAWAIATITRGLSRRHGAVLLAVAVVVQFVDLQGTLQARRLAARDPGFHTWVNPFVSERWAAIAPAYAHLALVPPPQCGEAPIPYDPAVRLAADHGLSVNAGLVSRDDQRARRRYCTDFDAEIDAVALRDDTLYVVSESAAKVLGNAGGDRALCGAVDAVWICTTPRAHGRWKSAAPFDRTVAPLVAAPAAPQ